MTDRSPAASPADGLPRGTAAIGKLGHVVLDAFIASKSRDPPRPRDYGGQSLMAEPGGRLGRRRVIGSWSDPSLGSPPHVMQVFQPRTGGVPVYAANLTEGLLAKGFVVTVACPPDALVVDRLRAAGAGLLPLRVDRQPHPSQDIGAIRSIAKYCRARGVSVIHGHSTKAGLLAGVAGRAAKAASIYTPHGWPFEMQVSPPSRLAFALVERRLARNYHAAVITVSLAGRRAAERWRIVPRGRIQVVWTGLPGHEAEMERSAARRALGVSQDAVLAGWVGRLGAQKRPQDLVDVARAVGDKADLIALCDGLEGETLADELKAAGVRVLGSQVTPATLYAAADMMLQTSAWEGFSIALLEAMSAGLPVIAYATGGAVEQIEHGRTGFAVPRGDTAALARRVVELAGDARTRTSLGTRAAKRVKDVFSYSEMLEQISRIYLAVGWPASRQSQFAGFRNELLAAEATNDPSVSTSSHVLAEVRE